MTAFSLISNSWITGSLLAKLSCWRATRAHWHNETLSSSLSSFVSTFNLSNVIEQWANQFRAGVEQAPSFSRLQTLEEDRACNRRPCLPCRGPRCSSSSPILRFLAPEGSSTRWRIEEERTTLPWLLLPRGDPCSWRRIIVSCSLGAAAELKWSLKQSRIDLKKNFLKERKISLFKEEQFTVRIICNYFRRLCSISWL